MMALALFKNVLLSNPRTVRKAIGIFSTFPRNVVSNYQYKPGPYPRTPEERAAAAKKYGMLIEEYQPYPEEMGYGDYPKLPDVGADSKDIHYPYDCPELKRNFNEPLHARAEMLGEDRCDPSFRPRYSPATQFAAFLTFMGVNFAIYFYLEDYKMGRPVTAKQYPWDGPHYYFTAK